MFSTMKRMWKEARADVATQEAIDIIQRYDQMGGYERYVLTSAFVYSKDELIETYGPIPSWPLDQLLSVSKDILKLSKSGYDKNPVGSCGGGLLSLYIEAHGLPGEKAERLIAIIDEWHMRAAHADLKFRD